MLNVSRFKERRMAERQMLVRVPSGMVLFHVGIVSVKTTDRFNAPSKFQILVGNNCL